MERRTSDLDLNIEYDTDYRDIKFPRLEFKTGKLLLVLPNNYKKRKQLLEKHKKWISDKNAIIEIAKRKAKNKDLSPKSDDLLKSYIRKFADKYSEDFQAFPNQIFFRKMNSKWGSCSPKRNLTFNTMMKYLPKNLIEYVTLHEFAHLIEKKHTERFWNIISQEFEDYKKKEKELLVYWFLVQDLK